jgi:hypothetical protein
LEAKGRLKALKREYKVTEELLMYDKLELEGSDELK